MQTKKMLKSALVLVGLFVFSLLVSATTIFANKVEWSVGTENGGGKKNAGSFILYDSTGQNAAKKYTTVANSLSSSGYIVSIPPNPSVACSNGGSSCVENGWVNSTVFTFNNAKGCTTAPCNFYVGGLSYYRYLWQQSPDTCTSANIKTGAAWSDANAKCPDGNCGSVGASVNFTAADGEWYLCVASYNGGIMSSDILYEKPYTTPYTRPRIYGPYKVDSGPPVTTDNWTDIWTSAQTVTITLTATDNSSSGIQWTKYCVDTDNNCDPTTGTTGTTVTVTCASSSVCTQRVRYASKDNANNTETTKIATVRQDSQVPTTSDNASNAWSTSDETVTLTPSNASGSGMSGGSAGTFYCVDTAGSCSPTTSGTSASVACTAGNICLQYV